MTDWRNEQIGVGVSRCPHDPENDYLGYPLYVSWCQKSPLTSDEVKALLESDGPFSYPILQQHREKSQIVAPPNWPQGPPEGFALPERRHSLIRHFLDVLRKGRPR